MPRRPDGRLKILQAMRGTRHRYEWLRLAGIGVSFSILLAVPLCGLARLDLWRGRHALLFAPAEVRPAVAGVLVAISALYVVTFLSNLAAGRVFCGWGCPVGQLCRVAETADMPRLAGRARLWARIASVMYGAALVFACFVWWVDPRVLVAGTPRALGLAWGLLLTGTTLAWVHGRFWRWGFCKSACPIGIYYSFVSPARWFGVHFRNAANACIECGLCDRVCPVDLPPRNLLAPLALRGGIAVADAPGRNHCLECGDCVRACQWILARRGRGPAPLRLGYYRGAQREGAPNEDRTAPL